MRTPPSPPCPPSPPADTGRTATDAKRFEATLAQANQLGVQAVETREQAVDTGLLLHLSHIGVDMARKLDPAAATRTPGDLVAALISAFVTGTLDAAANVQENPALFDWASLGQSVAHLFKPGIGMKCMLGPMQDAKPKEKRATQRRARVQLGEEVNPDVLTGAGKTDAEVQETDKNLDEMLRVIQRERCIPLPLLVLNKESMAQTVENIFTLSFIVKEGNASLSQDLEGDWVNVHVEHPNVKRGPPDSDAAEKRDLKSGARVRQLVTRFDMADWKAMVEDVGHHTTHIAHREHEFGPDGQLLTPGSTPVKARPAANIGEGKAAKRQRAV